MCNTLECVSIWDITSFILGIFLSAMASIIIIRFFRPKICLGNPEIKSNKIIFPVKNLNKIYSVTNLRIEAALVLNDETCHLKFDRYDFLMLSPLKTTDCGSPYERTFHAVDVEDYTKSIADNCKSLQDLLKLLENEKSYLRVRVHANHEFTGFGKAFQVKFKLNKNGEFEPISIKEQV